MNKTKFAAAKLSAASNAVFEYKVEGNDLPDIFLKQALKSGKLNLSNRGLVTVPDKVWNICEIGVEERKSNCWNSDKDKCDKWWEQEELTLLDLSSNRLTVIQSAIQNWGNLQTLNLHDNQLTSLPSEIQTLQNLSHLNLSHNKLDQLPDAIFQLVNLRHLNLKGNCLLQLSEQFGNLNLLDFLDLSANQLSILPSSITFLSRVNSLNLSNNLLVKFPQEIGSMLGLRSLDLSRNQLKELSPNIGQLPHLLQLHLNHNELASVPVLTSCTQLKELHVADNFLTDLQQEIFEPILKLQVLNVRDNHINKISDSIGNLQNLERLDLSNNDLNSLPSQLSALPHLKSLSLEGNPLKSIRRDILQRGTVQILKFLRSRSTEDSNSKESPVSLISNLSEIDIFQLRKNRSLDCSNCKASKIPDEYFRLAAEAEVTVIILNRNQLTDIPESIELALPKVSELQVSSNRLTSVSPVLQTAKHLQFLDLSCNQLSTLPQQLEALTQLREIWLSGNKFQQLPACVYKLKRLEIILASDNSIQVIEVDQLQQLSMLATLNLQNNNIQTVPPQLGNLTQLRSLQLEGNPFRQPRTAVLAKGTTALLEYLRDRIPK